jgi:sugar lactone lactonase YvrE
MSAPAQLGVEFAPIARGLYLEGLAVDDDAVWFSDVIRGGIVRLTGDGAQTRFLPELKWLAAIQLNDDGRVLCSGPGGIHWLDPDNGDTGIAVGDVDGTPLDGVNEMFAAPDGGLYFGTVDLPSIERGEQPRPVALHHVGVDGRARRLADGLVFTNGIALTADASTLVHNESFVGTFAYPIGADGTLGERRRLLDKDDCDGIALDVDGNFWICGFNSQEILCMTPEGDTLRSVLAPGGTVTNVRFAGDHLYITTVPVGAGDELAAGTVPTEERSVLYRGVSPVRGCPSPRPALRLG